MYNKARQINIRPNPRAFIILSQRLSNSFYSYYDNVKLGKFILKYIANITSEIRRSIHTCNKHISCARRKGIKSRRKWLTCNTVRAIFRNWYTLKMKE